MPTTPRCDLILLSWNHLDETQPCLESLFATVRTPCRLVIVDNASEPAVRRYLAAVKPQGAIEEVVLLQNETNEGFPRGMNRGLTLAQAPYVCLLNNDLRFTAGWLEELLRVAEAQPDAGLINPASNTFGNRPAPGRSLEEHARALQQARRGDYSEVGMGIGFCLLIRREVISRIGLLTEDVECCFYEDEDYSMRAVQAGYRCLVAEGSYVHHTEHASVKELPGRDQLFSRNQRWCDARWGRRIRVLWPRLAPVAPGSPELREWLERLLQWARRRTHVYVYGPLPEGMDAFALFRSVGMTQHSDIHWHAVPQPMVRVAAAWSVLRRRKKPFDVIVGSDPGWTRLVHGLSWLHRAEIVTEDNEEQLQDAWKRRSRSPS